MLLKNATKKTTGKDFVLKNFFSPFVMIINTVGRKEGSKS